MNLGFGALFHISVARRKAKLSFTSIFPCPYFIKHEVLKGEICGCFVPISWTNSKPFLGTCAKRLAFFTLLVKYN